MWQIALQQAHPPRLCSGSWRTTCSGHGVPGGPCLCPVVEVGHDDARFRHAEGNVPNGRSMLNLLDLEHRIAAGESEDLEFKKSTGQLNRAGETLCAFLNAKGGTVLIGVTAAGKTVGQEVSDKTEREIAGVLQRFEPPAPIEVDLVELPEAGRKLIVLQARPPADARPFTFDGRPYVRVRSTTSVMSQDGYEALLLDRAHARRR